MNKIVVILGPTASGKSELAAQLAKKFNGEIISADSRQVYMGLNIGTGKVPMDNSKTKSQNYYYKKVRHHLIDVVSPKRQFSVAMFQKLGQKALQDIFRRGKLPIICGGTGFYIDALIYNYSLPAVLPQEALRRDLEKETTEALFEKLRKKDPKRARDIDRNNRRRLIRALEIVITTGSSVPPISERESIYSVLKIGIKKEPGSLRKLIAKRLRTRILGGMIEEVERLHDDGLSWKRMEELGLEYRYVSRFLQGLITRERMLESLEKEIWHYAKRQMTWFKKDKETCWFRTSREAEKAINDFLKK